MLKNQLQKQHCEVEIIGIRSTRRLKFQWFKRFAAAEREFKGETENGDTSSFLMDVT